MKAIHSLFLSVLVFLASLPVFSSAGGNKALHAERTNSNPSPVTGVAVAARTGSPPRIDGDLDDPAWRSARPLENMVQSYPEPGKAPSFSTDVKLLYDRENLYLAADCKDPEPGGIVARITRRDRWIESDWFEVDIDSRKDKRNGFFFAVNARGVKLDGLLFDDTHRSTSWDGNWESATRITARGWTVEMRIPLYLLRFNARRNVSFGIQFRRRISRLNEWDQWPFIPPGSGCWVSCFGSLNGLDLSDTPLAHAEITPYVALKGIFEDDHMDMMGEPPIEAGVDAKINLGSDFMLTLAANPDFGQVEVDQVVLNLSTIETYFPEKRPFFLEDITLFKMPDFGDGPKAELFYTRRIGRAPREVELDEGQELLHQPEATRIYGAAKLAGNIGRLSLGFLQAVTAREDALIRTTNKGDKSMLAEPLSSYSILRLRQGFLHHSQAGLMATVTATDGQGAAITGGNDLQLELFDQDYELALKTQFSYLSPKRRAWHDDFTRAAIDRDGAFGYGGDMVFRKVKGEHLVGAVLATWRSPTLALNDLGYQDRQDIFMNVYWLQYRRLKPIGPVAKFQLNFNGWLYRNTTMMNIGDGINVNGDVFFKNNWNVGADAGFHPPACNDRETRSAGKVALCSDKFNWDTGIWFDSDRRLLFSGGMGAGFDSTENGYNLHVSMNLALNPTARLQFELIPRYKRVTGRVSWLDTIETQSGSRFLFSNRHEETWDITLRSTLTFTANLTLQAYAQVFMASVDYGKKLAGPVPPGSRIKVKDLEPAPDVNDDYDFADTAMNVSVVLRWEFLPGSLAYLVYTGAFGADLDTDEFRFGSLFGHTFDEPARHVLMLKVSFTFY